MTFQVILWSLLESQSGMDFFFFHVDKKFWENKGVSVSSNFIFYFLLSAEKFSSEWES